MGDFHIATKSQTRSAARMPVGCLMRSAKKPLVRTAKSGRPIIALDGCPLQCAKQILKRQGLSADKHYDLSRMGVEKKYHHDFDPQQAADVLRQVQGEITRFSNVEKP